MSSAEITGICAKTLTNSIGLGVLALAMLGCESDGPSQADRDRLRAEGESIFTPQPGEAGNTPWSAWSIVLGMFPAAQRARAEESLTWTRSVGGLTEARLERRSGSWVVAYGVYAGADDATAQGDLARVRELVVDGRRPFAGAVLAPPIVEAAEGDNAAWDLSKVRAARGEDARYTLQVGIYGRSDTVAPSPDEIAEFRRSAERAVKDLRAQGEEAYYYHGLERSTVAVGVFGLPDFDPATRPGYRSPALVRAMESHPYNLMNGQGIRERVVGTNEYRLQPSRLVEIPEGS